MSSVSCVFKSTVLNNKQNIVNVAYTTMLNLRLATNSREWRGFSPREKISSSSFEDETYLLVCQLHLRTLKKLPQPLMIWRINAYAIPPIYLSNSINLPSIFICVCVVFIGLIKILDLIIGTLSYLR